MSTNAKTLPGFKEIEFSESGSLFVYHRELIREGSVVKVYGSFTGIPLEGLAGCKVTTETVSGETVYTTQVDFMIRDCGEHTRRLIHDLVMNDCCFRLTDVYREKYLLGLSGKPHPVVKPSFRSEALPSGGRVFAVEIQYINTHSLLHLE
jgi:hypothetical protein